VGVVGGDSVSLSAGSATGAFSDKNAGIGKTVTVSGFSVTGTDAGNYSLGQPAATANITAKGLTFPEFRRTTKFTTATPPRR